MRQTPFLFLVAALAGCTSGVSEGPAPSEAEVLDGPPTQLVLQRPVYHLDGLGREPMLVEHPDGTLFVSGYESQVRGTDPRLTPKLLKSADGGKTWVRVPVGTPEEGAAGNSDEEVPFFPYLVARGSGELAATWFSGRGESLAAHVALIGVPQVEGDELAVLRSQPFQPDSWLESEDSPARDPAGDYLPVAFLSGGGLGVVSPVQDAPGNRFGFTWWRLEIR